MPDITWMQVILLWQWVFLAYFLAINAAYLSLNYIAEQGLQIGSRLPLRVMPERMRFF